MTESLTYAPLKSRALIAVSGPDWRGFLQGLITQDVETLAPGEARFGALLTPQGRLLYDLFVVGREDGCWLDVLAEHRAAILQRLAMYRLRAKVEIAADETAVSILYAAHPRAGGDPSGASAALDSARVPAFAGTSGFVRDPRLPALGWRGYGAEPPPGAILADESARDAAKLTLGVPGPADWGSDKTYPIEANFDLLNGIAFQKGCFVGQETTSRMKRRGQVKSRMLPIAFAGPPPAVGAEVLSGELRAGVVTSAGEGRAIALMRLDRAEGASLTVDGRPVTLERPAWFLAALGVEAA
ncbi:folate-binding protein YgfZ [Phenylobacterium sp.]|uniref:CAF17-like 4Fe-4S cluster assembly/insertion protein YgfZ n=1 Tax=Phenylobacterium sp. TaxID=1871053 RepID=UPI00120481FD|nr:folate-binding protein YgfZ [Phenylobacterium sp.]THD64433.1 MAG: folate-binding protein [Phenylobacterium sp.]